MKKNKFLKNLISEEIINLRRELHQYPELSGLEFETVKRIRKFIEPYNPTAIIDNIGDTGLAVIYEYPKEGPVITIRCELDALPIQEENQFNHKSKTNGVSHKCGHDGHMAIVAGLAQWLKTRSFKSGKVILLFQPAEETGQGANKVLKSKKFRNLNSDFVFALHNIPGYPLHNIITMKEGFSAEVVSFSISLNGKKSHAAEPENGINPAIGLSELINALSKMNNPNPEDNNYAILTPIYINMGEKSYGISPANGELHYTIRSWSKEKMESLKSEIEDHIKRICQSKKIEFKLNWFEYFPASENDLEANTYVTNAAKENNYELLERPYPFKFGEDFGWYSKDHKTAMFGLGSGENMPALHHTDYDFPDEIIETGINMFKSIISNILKTQ